MSIYQISNNNKNNKKSFLNERMIDCCFAYWIGICFFTLPCSHKSSVSHLCAIASANDVFCRCGSSGLSIFVFVFCSGARQVILKNSIVFTDSSCLAVKRAVTYPWQAKVKYPRSKSANERNSEQKNGQLWLHMLKWHLLFYLTLIFMILVQAICMQ